MKRTEFLMGMPITLEIIDKKAKFKDTQKVFDYFKYIDEKFSTYKETSEINVINKGLLVEKNYSRDMREVLRLCELTKKQTNGYFNILNNGKLDPSGLVKGWAIFNAAKILKKKGFRNYYVDAGGDIQGSGKNSKGTKWIVGIRNPFNRFENIKILRVGNAGVATSGTAIRGQHIYNPLKRGSEIKNIVSITVIGADIYNADRFATAAFAMEEKGLSFIETLAGFEGYMIDRFGVATYTSGFEKYLI